MKMTPDEMCELGFRLLVMPPDDRKHRKAWLPLLTEALEGDVQELLLCLTGEEWRIIRQALDASEDGLTIRFGPINRDTNLRDAVHQLRAMGLCARDAHAWHMLPRVREILDADATLWQIEETADLVYLALLGYLRIYGMAPARDLARMTAPVLKGKAIPEDVTEDDFIVGVWRRRNGLADLLMATDGLWLICPEAEDVEALYKELHQPQLQMKSYAPYSTEEAIACGRGAPPGRCDAYDEILSFYFAHGVDRQAGLDAIDHAVLLFQLGQFEESIAALVEPMSTPPTPTQLRLLKLVFLRAPAWRMKGSCAEDMMSPSARISKRVRQDDPCPCGSGRKYKHCCGRLQ